VLEVLGIFTQPNEGFHTTWMVVTATIYRSIYTVGGGYITAALAPNRPMRYVMILGIIGTVAGILAAISNHSDGNSTHLVSDRTGRTCAALYVVRRKVEN
jgi:hypothetical protein